MKYCYLCADYEKIVKNNRHICQFAINRNNHICSAFKYKNKDFSDELEEYLFKTHGIKSSDARYPIARKVAERLIEDNDIGIQYFRK